MKRKSKVLLVLIAVCAALLFTGTTALADTTVDCPNGAECTTHAAAIGSTHYDTLEEALDAVAASTEQPIVILNDTTFATAKTIAEGITLTIDLNGKTVIASRTITNSGTLTIKDSTAEADDISGGSGAWKSSVNPAIENYGTLTVDGAKITNTSYMAIATRSSSSVTIKSGTLTGSSYSIYARSGSGAVIDIEKGILNGRFLGSDVTALNLTIGNYGSADDTVVINGIVNLKEAHIITVNCGDIKQFSGTYNPETMQINCKLRNTTSLVLPAGYFLSEGSDDNGVYYTIEVLDEENAGAKIETAAGDTAFYGDAASAAAALQTGDKLTILKEYADTLDIATEGISIDLGGNRIDTLEINLSTQGKQEGELAAVSVSNGTVDELIAGTRDSRYYFFLDLADNVNIEQLNLKNAYATYSDELLPEMKDVPTYSFTNDENVRCLTSSTTIALELSPDHIAYLAQDYTGSEKIGVGISGTIDLGGNTFASSSDSVLSTQVDQTLIVRNGSLVNNGGGDIVVTQIPGLPGQDLPVAINCDLTLENVDMIGEGSFGIVTHGNSTNVNVTLRDCSISGAPNVGIYFPSADSVLTIDNSDITAGTGIGIKGGTLNIIGDSNIHATGERRDPTTPEGSGINSTGDAIYVEANYGRETIVNIESGSFVSDNAEAVRMLFDESAPANQYEVEVSGGSYSSPVAEEYLADSINYELNSGDGYSYYADLDDAMDAAAPGDEIKTVNQAPATETHTVTLDYDVRSMADTVVEVADETEFTLPDATRSGYDLVGWEDEDGDTYDVGDEIEITRDREFTAIWEEIDEGEYRIRIVVTGNGSVESSDNYADEGDRITLTVDPDRGYELYSLTITDASGDRVSYRDRGDGEYTFTMPDSRVTVRAIFVEINEGLPFVDVSSNAWYYDAVEYVYDNDLFEGMSAYIFGPNEPMNRGMLVTVLYRLEGEPRVNGDNTFSDVGDNLWYSDAVVWANSHGIVEGYNGSFRPLDNINREEMAAVMYRYAVYKGLDVVTLEENLGGFVDGSEVSDWAVQSMNWAVGQGVLHGKGANNLDPQGIATRAEVAQILMNYLEG